MAILHFDDFGIYDEVRASGNMDLQWLSKSYEIRQTTESNLRIYQSVADVPYRRNILGTGSATIGQRSVYAPLGEYLVDHTRVGICQKIVDYTPNGNAIGGISLVSPDVEDHILAFGFSTLRNGFIKYVGPDNKVVVEQFILTTSLSGFYDTLEWSIEKEVNDATQYRSFILWVNNRPAYVGNIMPQRGSAGALHARIHGAVNTKAEGADASDGRLNADGNVTIPAYGTTDLAITDGPRLGRVMAVARQAAGDIGPNTMTPSDITADSHADVINKIPPDTSRYLSAVSAAAEERFWAQAFPDLGSENVLAVAVRVLGMKNSPDALDLVPTVVQGQDVYSPVILPTDLTPRFGSLVLDKNPLTGLNWTPSEANSLQFGVKVA